VVAGAGGEDARRFARIARLSVPRRIVVSTPDTATAAVGGAGVAHLPGRTADELDVSAIA
jgi:hypothetical protein